MTIHINTLGEAGILEVVYASQAVSPEGLAEQRRLVAEALSRSTIRKVLLDATALRKFPPILTVLRHNESVAADDILRRARFAVVCSTIGEDERALENTGVNRGVSIRCFTSREQALAWLA